MASDQHLLVLLDGDDVTLTFRSAKPLIIDGRIISEVQTRASDKNAPRLTVNILPTAEVPTDRAHLLAHPEPGDECDHWTRDPMELADCESDGHYLCATCTRRSPSEG